MELHQGVVLRGVRRPRHFSLGIGRARALCAVVLLSFAAAGPVHANGPEVGRDAGGVFPIRSEGIRLVSEGVDLQLSGAVVDRGRAECSYGLRNETDTEKTIEMTFVYKEPHMWNSRGFRVFLQGPLRRVPVHFEPIDQDKFREFITPVPDSLPVWKVTIPPGEMVTVSLDYVISWTSVGSTYLFEYYARPAALWDGNVESARIRVEFLGLFGELVRCAPMDSCLSWTIEPPG